MEILVLVMLALFLIIIAIAVIIYVSVRKNSVDKKFDNVFDSKINDDDDDDDDDYVPLNIVMPSSLKKEHDLVKEIEENKEEIKIISPVVIEEKEDKQGKLADVINVLINKKNYIFLANNNILSKNDHIKLVLDGKVYFGTVTKANYQRDISLLKTKPRKLIIVKNKEKNDANDDNKKINDKNKFDDVEIIPVKKEKN